MKGKSVGFIGGGRVASILLGGWAKAGVWPEKVVVSDPNDQVLARLKERYPQIETVGGDNTQPAAQDMVFFGVHPPMAAEVLGQVAPVLRPDAILISLAPKWSIAKISVALGGFSRIVRMIPNAPSIIGAGYNPVAFGAGLSEAERTGSLECFKLWGKSPEVAEEKLELYALLTAMGPTYFWYQFYELLGVIQGAGMPDAEAFEGLKNMLCGALQVMEKSGLDAAQVMDLVPVKPLAEFEAGLTEGYRTKLPALLEKIRP
ncbi:MAG TPA: NAD(P)-binding domain-containing protein [Candidatus Sumerlaeota bacterium]|nr:NAD(P)-binding domain-containing protein [Candidatus Sumerlaeota bacterium]HPS00603.1 NAD(P)-binding domain-containing protein [Candidatus Sumerlaeota bacterium]